jgi:hypothetical protein
MRVHRGFDEARAANALYCAAETDALHAASESYLRANFAIDDLVR